MSVTAEGGPYGPRHTSPQAPPDEMVLVRFGPSARLTLFHFDLAVITVWFMVTPVQFRYDELLLYPMALYFTFAFFRDRHVTWPIFKAGFILLLLPGWWLMSALWSPEPVIAFRTGLQVILTILICMFIASRLTTRQLLMVLLVAMTTILARSFPQALFDLSVGSPSKAIYTHKNPFGTDMSVLWVTALALLLVRDIPVLIRWLALAVLPLALLMVFASQSATAILISFGMAGILIGARLYLGNNNVLTFPRIAAISVTVFVVTVGLTLAINLSPVDPVTLVLNALGKDASLTGRTDLWSIAMVEIEERPLMGTGAYGYWRYDDNAFVRQIFIDFYRERGNVFHFHNAWLELSVNLGLVGLGLAAVAMIWAIFMLIMGCLRLGGADSWVLLAIAGAVLARTMTEADLFSQFVMLHMILWTGALIMARSGKPGAAPHMQSE